MLALGGQLGIRLLSMAREAHNLTFSRLFESSLFWPQPNTAAGSMTGTG
jgi:hypothetical protein